MRNAILTKQHFPEVYVRPVKWQRGLKCMPHHNKWNGEAVLRHKEPPKWFNQVQRVWYVLKHHLVLLPTQYGPLGSQAPEIDRFWGRAIQCVLTGPHKTVACVGWVYDAKTSMGTYQLLVDTHNNWSWLCFTRISQIVLTKFPLSASEHNNMGFDQFLGRKIWIQITGIGILTRTWINIIENWAKTKFDSEDRFKFKH